MSAAAPPTIPPRPVRAEAAAAHGADKLPEMPPRPVPRRMERSRSPANYPQSPLNEPFNLNKVRSIEPQAPRLPSVHHLPTPGEEGMEYANVQYQPVLPASALAQDAAAQTRSVGDELHLHAPKPSLPKSSATAQVQAVTRTDSMDAASPGLEKIASRTKSRGSFSRPDSAGSGLRRFSNDPNEDHAPTEPIGLRVPINPLLGDVQAPTPSGLSPQATGESGKRHSRRRSQMDDFRPPGSYGLHGHGIIPQDKFERDWYMKHPDQLEHEEGQGHGVYEGIGSGRGNFALSREELNKIVRETASRGSGFGTREDIRSYPDEQIGYIASEEYQRSQQNTPLPELSRTQTQLSQPAAESPLRKASFPEDSMNSEGKGTRKSSSIKSDHALDSEGEDFHIDLPNRRFNKVTGGQETINETEDAKPYASHFENHGEYRVPILAEDETSKDLGSEYMQPAVSPKYERRGSSHANDEHGSGHHTPLSRPSSRPGSVYNLHSASHSLSRFLSHQDEREHLHTPLEDVAEYEPLFEDDDGKKSLSHAERFKRRPDALQKRFPSMDIWEDTPNSFYQVAEVSTPDLPSTAKEPRLEAPPTFESPEKEAARKGEYLEAEKREQGLKEERLHKSKFAPHLRDAVLTRPGLLQRFPSQDIWEDTPDSSQLVTTVSSPPIDDDDEKPPIPARPAKSRLGEGASSNQMEPSVPPSIPARPTKRVHAVPAADATLTDAIPLARESSPTELKKVPSIPDRPKPQIPPRPAKKAGDDGLTKVPSSGSIESTETVTSPALSKAKPQVPPRPAAGNFASIKGNFMSDLNKKLGLGPPKEKEKEPESEAKEVKPLEDARKGRARGPQRRAPAKSPSATASKPVMGFSMSKPLSIWSIDDEGSLKVGIEKAKKLMSEDKIAQIDHAAPADAPLPPIIDTSSKAGQTEAERPSDAPKSLASGLARNTAGEMADPVRGMDDDDNTEGELTRKTTASTISGQPLEREETDPNADAIPASRQTTATDSEQNDPEEKLERVLSEERQPEKIAEDEPIKIRHEQVNSAAPDNSDTELSSSTDQSSTSNPASSVPVENKGEEAPKEPMNEDDVNYKKLEEMTAKADGKLHAEEEPEFSSRKVVD